MFFLCRLEGVRLMDENVLVHILSNVGIPAALCFYTLFNVNKNLEKLTEAVNRWNESLDRRLTELENDVKALQMRGG